MARKKDLGGLAALAGLAYMASRDKAPKGADRDTDTGVDVQPSYGKASAATAPDMGEIRDEEGTLSKLRRNTETGEAYDPTGSGSSMAAPLARSTATRATPKAPSAPRDDQYNPSVKQRLKDDQYNPDVKARKKAAYETPYDRTRREDREAGRDIGSVVESLKNRIATAGERGSALPLKSTKADTNEFMGSGMKKGGSVKGWGISRGARKAKNY